MQSELAHLKRRNQEKDKGKKFEGSWTRVIVIMLLTYATLSIYMALVLHVDEPLLNALVPTIGFNLSTWSLPQVKKAWIRFYDWQRHGTLNVPQEDIETNLRPDVEMSA